MAFIGIVGARKYKDRQSVENLIEKIPDDSTIVTSGCKGVCTWVKQKAEQQCLEVLVFQPDLTNIRSRFEIPKRYYERNKELVRKCDLLHAFISIEGGYSGGTKFEAEYALRLGKSVMLHREKDKSELVCRYPLSLTQAEPSFSQAWQGFFEAAFA